jgi:uncharacterized protein DUF6946
MTNFFAPADRADDWQQLLAKPNLHWKTGYSAKSLAYRWTEANGFPAEVAVVLSSASDESIRDLEFLLGFPENDVDLPGGKRPSQNFVFVLAKSARGLVTIAVEGRVSEPFDLPIKERFTHPTPGQIERLEFLCNLLDLEINEIGYIRYQLLHRFASALIEASRFGASQAIMLVHSFTASSITDRFWSTWASIMSIWEEKIEPG